MLTMDYRVKRQQRSALFVALPWHAIALFSGLFEGSEQGRSGPPT